MIRIRKGSVFQVNKYLYIPYQHISFEPCSLAHLSTECSVGYCDHSPSVGVRPSDVLQSIGPQFLAHMSTECSVSYCGHTPSVGVRLSAVRPSVHDLLVNTLSSTNIHQSSPNLVKMYMTTRARMSYIVEPFRLELSELSALKFENLPYSTMFTL